MTINNLTEHLWIISSPVKRRKRGGRWAAIPKRVSSWSSKRMWFWLKTRNHDLLTKMSMGTKTCSINKIRTLIWYQDSRNSTSLWTIQTQTLCFKILLQIMTNYLCKSWTGPTKSLLLDSRCQRRTNVFLKLKQRSPWNKNLKFSIN